MKKLLSILILGSFFALEAYSNEKIPVQHFFCDSAMTSGTLSPNGKYFAAMVPATGAKCSIEDDDDLKQQEFCLLLT